MYQCCQAKPAAPGGVSYNTVLGVILEYIMAKVLLPKEI